MRVAHRVAAARPDIVAADIEGNPRFEGMPLALSGKSVYTKVYRPWLLGRMTLFESSASTVRTALGNGRKAESQATLPPEISIT